jgi:hypothetical protein
MSSGSVIPEMAFLQVLLLATSTSLLIALLVPLPSGFVAATAGVVPSLTVAAAVSPAALPGPAEFSTVK